MRILDLTNQYGLMFLGCFEAAGYDVVNGVPVSSKIDPSVYLVGSTISVLKSRLLGGPDIPHCVMVQRAIRTQSLCKMEHGQYQNGIYGSYFIAMGTLAPYHWLEETVALVYGFIREFLPLSEPPLFRVSNMDSDLRAACQKTGPVELDSRPITYYRHRYGLETQKVSGRNCNLAISSGGRFLDIANIIVIERDGVPFAVEFAMGMSTFLTHLYGFPHTMLGNTVADVLPMRRDADYSLGDCVSVVHCLLREGIVPNSSKMQGRLLKRYQNVMLRLCSELGKYPDELLAEYAGYDTKLCLPL